MLAPGEDAVLRELRASGEDADGSEMSDACDDEAAGGGNLVGSPLLS